MANRGGEEFIIFLAATEELAKGTLAHHLASDEKKSQLVALFRMLAEFVEEYQPDINLQAVYGKTLLGVIDSERIRKWVEETLDSLIASGGSAEDLLTLLWPFITSILDSYFSRYLPISAVLPVVYSWVRGESFELIMGVWQANDGAIRHGEGTRKTKMEDIAELCENAAGYQSTLIVAAIAEVLGSLDREDTEDLIRALGTLQKQLKYGISDPEEIALYELGFADRVVAQALRPIVAQVDGQTVRQRLRNSATAVQEALGHFPRYFSVCLSSLI